MGATTAQNDRQEKAERVRRALMAAETATGLRPVEWAAPPPRQRSQSAEQASAQYATPSEHLPSGHLLPSADWLPVPPALTSVIPHGALRRGSTVAVTGSLSLLLHVAASLTGEGAWTALVSQPDLGLAAAVDAGIDPARCVVVPQPGPDAPDVLAALIDGFDVVVVGECTALRERDRRSLSTRVRHRGATLLSTVTWPGADVVLDVRQRLTHGLDGGRGHLRSEHLQVSGHSRGMAPGSQVMLQISGDGSASKTSRTSLRLIAPTTVAPTTSAPTTSAPTTNTTTNVTTARAS